MSPKHILIVLVVLSLVFFVRYRIPNTSNVVSDNIEITGSYNKMKRIIRVKNARLIKRVLTVNEVLEGLPYSYGTQDEYGRMEKVGCIGNGEVIVYNADRIGRGVQIIKSNKQFIELALRLPSTSYDVDVLYDLAKNIARQWSSKRIVDVDSGQKVLLSDIITLKDRDNDININLLSYTYSFDPYIVVCPSVFYPISIDSHTIKSFGTKETYSLYADYLHSRQTIEAYYCRVIIASYPELGGIIGLYPLSADIDIIVPIKPEAMYDSDDGVKECDQYYMAFPSDAELLKVDYDTFIAKVPANLIEQFDATHWHLKPMSRELLDALFEGK